MTHLDEMNAKLRQLYEKALGEIKELIPKTYTAEEFTFSEPHFLKVSPEYLAASTRLLVVGQQTAGYQNIGENVAVERLMDAYEDFALGRQYFSSPFWQAAHQLYKLLNPDGPDRGFMWSNLVKVEQNLKRPAPEMEEAVCSLGILNGEIDILKPDVIVFFTGPNYDSRVATTFKGLRVNQLSARFCQLAHPELPRAAYRTNHPRDLRLTKNWDVLEEIAKFSLQAV
jgi:hypothetical protein